MYMYVNTKEIVHVCERRLWDSAQRWVDNKVYSEISVRAVSH